MPFSIRLRLAALPVLALAAAGLLTPGAASAQAVNGSVEGTVTGPLGAPLAGICVLADGGTDGGQTSSDIDGTYSLSLNPELDYIIRFQECEPGILQGEWYNDAQTLAEADPVSVDPGLPTTGINAQLVADTVPPDTNITDGPPGQTNSSTVSFQFESTEGESTFECSLDGSAFTSCSPPHQYTGVADGEHTFRVRAIDRLGNVDPTPDSRTFTVDSTPPETTIDTGPDEGATVSSTTVSFTFHSSKPNSSYFCRIDGGNALPCSSPETYTDLVNGPHTFTVRAIDQAGNSDGSPASRSFTVDAGGEGDITPPQTTIDDRPQGTIPTDTAQFTFHASEAGSVFQCSLDGGDYEECTTPRDASGLAEGAHVFRVFAVDAAGNIDQSPAEWNFIVDTIAPDTTIQTGPSGTTSGNAVEYTFTSNEANASFECSLDGASYEPCASPKGYAGLAPGDHDFAVRAYDAAGNRDGTAANRSFTVPEDTTPPATTIDSGPTGTTGSANASFTFSSSESGSSFACRMDGGTFTSCTSPKGYVGLADGSHTFEVIATDGFGNADATPASRTFSVDRTAPDTSISAGPSGTVASGSVSFAFASEAGATFQCSLDGSAYASCTSPKDYSGLADGAHTFSVRGVDAVGNTDASPAARTFSVQTPVAPPPPAGDPECDQAQAQMDQAKSALTKAKAKLKKAKSKAAKKKAKAKVKKAQSKVKAASGNVAAACG